MTSRSDTNTAKIRALIKEQPHMTAKQIAEVVGCRPQAVHSVKYLDKRNLRKSGTPTKKVRKIRITKTQANLAKRLKVPLTAYAKELAGFDTRSDIIADLRHQIVGFRAVISYLENQLGLKNSQ
jgi:predicted transcriptional regulator